MLNRITFALATIMLTAVAALASDIMVMDPRAAASLTPNARTGAVYLMLMNHGATTDALLKVTSPAADMAMAHQTLEEDGVMKMREITRLELPPQATFAMAPGGSHIMLVGLKAPLKEGNSLSLVLTFERAGEITVDVPIVNRNKLPAAASHEHMEQ